MFYVPQTQKPTENLEDTYSEEYPSGFQEPSRARNDGAQSEFC